MYVCMYVWLINIGQDVIDDYCHKIYVYLSIVVWLNGKYICQDVMINVKRSMYFNQIVKPALPLLARLLFSQVIIMMMVIDDDDDDDAITDGTVLNADEW